MVKLVSLFVVSHKVTVEKNLSTTLRTYWTSTLGCFLTWNRKTWLPGQQTGGLPLILNIQERIHRYHLSGDREGNWPEMCLHDTHIALFLISRNLSASFGLKGKVHHESKHSICIGQRLRVKHLQRQISLCTCFAVKGLSFLLSIFTVMFERHTEQDGSNAIKSRHTGPTNADFTTVYSETPAQLN